MVVTGKFAPGTPTTFPNRNHMGAEFETSRAGAGAVYSLCDLQKLSDTVMNLISNAPTQGWLTSEFWTQLWEERMQIKDLHNRIKIQDSKEEPVASTLAKSTGKSSLVTDVKPLETSLYLIRSRAIQGKSGVLPERFEWYFAPWEFFLPSHVA
ncbi:hypothetical protein PoB_004486300 [Plakobranchus ocellatus]|uniref:Uncharacterized protein n=1 Tax=Plakobranchus ocellatus TaxID=259542 RepID=A0AAV4BHR2_9GAST|nr:hypothetical protein PoB_004486300 [Plakobranchus ocellatus]